MNTVQIRDTFLHWNGKEYPLEIEFVSTNSCSKGTRHGGGPSWFADYTCGSYNFSDAFRRRNQSKNYPKSFHSGFSEDFDTDDNQNPLARSIKDGTDVALSYSIVREGRNNLVRTQQRHLVISAPPSNAVGRHAPEDVTEVFERYLCHRGTRMADAYCNTLGMNPRWSVQRVIDSEIFEYGFGPRSMRNIPVSQINDSVVDAFSECTHIHLFDDHIVYGGTMRAMLCSVVEIISQIGRLAEPPIISVTCWHSITAASKVRRLAGYYPDDLIIPPDVISGKQKWANRSSRETENYRLLDRLQESDSEFSRSPSIRDLMGSENCVGPIPPVHKIVIYPHIESLNINTRFTYDVVYRIGHIIEGKEKLDFRSERLPEEALDWYEFIQYDQG